MNGSPVLHLNSEYKMADSQSLYVIDWKSGRMYNYSCVRDVISMTLTILWCHLCLLLTLLDRVGVASRLLAVNTASVTSVDHHYEVMLRSSTTCRIVKVKKSNSLSRHISNFAYRRTSQSMRELEMSSPSSLCVSPPTPASLKEDICEKYLVICQILKWGTTSLNGQALQR